MLEWESEEEATRRRHILPSPFSGVAIRYSFVPVYVRAFHSLLSPMGSRSSSITALFGMLPVESASLQGFVLLWLCKPQHHWLFPTAQYVSLCNLASLELQYNMRKKIISLLKCLCIKHYKFKLGVHGLTRDNPGLAQCKVSKDFPLLAKRCSVNKDFRNNIIVLKGQCKWFQHVQRYYLEIQTPNWKILSVPTSKRVAHQVIR